MTGGLGFLNLKSFHPSNKSNQRKLFIAEQKAQDAVKRERERQRELEQQQDLYKNRQLLGSKEQKEKHKAQQEMNWAYAPPPGFKPPKAQDDESEDASSKVKSKHEEETEKFPFLANAPVQGQYTDNIQVHHRPFGIELRNVKCARCHQWGHQSGDRECPMKDEPNPHDAQRQKMEDPMGHILFPNESNEYNDGLVLKKSVLSPNVSHSGTDFPMLPEEVETANGSDESDDDVEKQFLASLTKKQRKLLLKEFKRQERKRKRNKKNKEKHKKKKKEERKAKEKGEKNNEEVDAKGEKRQAVEDVDDSLRKRKREDNDAKEHDDKNNSHESDASEREKKHDKDSRDNRDRNMDRERDRDNRDNRDSRDRDNRGSGGRDRDRDSRDRDRDNRDRDRGRDKVVDRERDIDRHRDRDTSSRDGRDRYDDRRSK